MATKEEIRAKAQAAREWLYSDSPSDWGEHERRMNDLVEALDLAQTEITELKADQQLLKLKTLTVEEALRKVFDDHGPAVHEVLNLTKGQVYTAVISYQFPVEAEYAKTVLADYLQEKLRSKR